MAGGTKTARAKKTTSSTKTTKPKRKVRTTAKKPTVRKRRVVQRPNLDHVAIPQPLPVTPVAIPVTQSSTTATTMQWWGAVILIVGFVIASAAIFWSAQMTAIALTNWSLVPSVGQDNTTWVHQDYPLMNHTCQAAYPTDWNLTTTAADILVWNDATTSRTITVKQYDQVGTSLFDWLKNYQAPYHISQALDPVPAIKARQGVTLQGTTATEQIMASYWLHDNVVTELLISAPLNVDQVIDHHQLNQFVREWDCQ